MSDDTIRSIENELTMSQDSEQTLNRRLSKLEDGNYIRNLIKHYSDIFLYNIDSSLPHIHYAFCH